MFAASVPVALQALDRAAHFCDLIAAEPEPERLLSAKLHPGMFDCAGQLRTVAIFALRATFPLIGQPWPRGDFEPGLAGLRARIAFARAAISGLTEADFVGAQERQIVHTAGVAELDQNATEYLRHFALPNLWFHLSMVYATLRSEGVAIGKADFDGLHVYPAGFSWEK